MRKAESDSLDNMTAEDLEKFFQEISSRPGGKSVIRAYLKMAEDESGDADAKAYSDPDYGRGWSQKSKLETDIKRDGNPTIVTALNQRFSIGAGANEPAIQQMLRIYRKEEKGYRTAAEL